MAGSNSGNIEANPRPATAPAMPPAPLDPELAAVVAAWAGLPAAIKDGIVAMVKAGAGGAGAYPRGR